ncbi:periplasmic protein [Escherichia phage EcS1]|uniref:Uncharacterized protein n=1 Tax=Escherichia phage EcS1 TaxID=2083276 RepID=A0A2Z5ZCG2_9CAUD|nr:periplasmic protein [Escherichia phage EcS1]BBC78339.1 Hypothetical protein [Escherichia phage EcS1]
MRKLNRQGSWISKVFPWFFGFVLVAILASWAFQGWVAYNLVDAVQKEGLKSVVEVIWNGANK